MSNLVPTFPRPLIVSVFDRLQYAKMEGKGLVHLNDVNV